MQYLKKSTTQVSLALFASLIAVEFMPHEFRVHGVAAIFLSLVLATVADSYVSPKRIWTAARKAAVCGCNTAMSQVAKLPALLQDTCANCGAEMA